MIERTIASILCMISLVLIIITLGEYRSLRTHIHRIRVLQNSYYGHLDILGRMMRMQRKPQNVIKRKSAPISCTPSRVKQSSISSLNEQKFTKLPVKSNERDVHIKQLPVADLQSDTMNELEPVPCPEEQGVVPLWAQIPRRKSKTGTTFICPLDRSRFWLSSLFGARKKPNGQVGFHYGIDMASQRGTDVYAAAPGVVEYAGCAPGYGNTIVIVHDKVYKTRYAHLDEIHVTKNQRVKQGTTIGAVGDTGFTISQGQDGSHLHFELYEHGKQVNPLLFILV